MLYAGTLLAERKDKYRQAEFISSNMSTPFEKAEQENQLVCRPSEGLIQKGQKTSLLWISITDIVWWRIKSVGDIFPEAFKLTYYKIFQQMVKIKR